MADVVATAVTEIPSGYNNENIIVFQATVGVANAADTVKMTLPTRWLGIGVGIVSATIMQWVTADAGARTKTFVPLSGDADAIGIVEATGVISLKLGAVAIANPCRAIVMVCPSA
jgi:hypothetical protein